MKKCRNWVCVVQLSILLLGVGALHASNNEQSLSPYFHVSKPTGSETASLEEFPLKSTSVDINISGIIANVKVTQTYQNSGKVPIHGSYVFPASARAAVHGMTMRIGDYEIKAKVKEKEVAKQEFDQAKKAGKSASLLEQKRPNVFSMNVANIMPGDTIAIELEYTEMLSCLDGVYNFVYPTVVGPRYTELTEQTASSDDGWQKSPYTKSMVKPSYTFDLKASVSAGIPINDLKSSSHTIAASWANDRLVNIELDQSESFGGNRDFILNYRLKGNQIESGLILYEDDDENYFLFMAQPPVRIGQKDIPPREYIFVIDVSGSMNGFPLSVSKDLFKSLIADLRPTDKFNIILFAASSTIMSLESLEVNEENVKKAIDLMDNQHGSGSTKLNNAIMQALTLPQDKTFSRSVIVITDGYIDAERDVFSLIESNLNKCNFFSFGIGSSVNRYLIDGIAKAGQGEPFVVTNNSEAPAIAERFRKYIESPVLTNIDVKFHGLDVYDVEPQTIPDMFAERPIVLTGKWKGSIHGSLSISGQTGMKQYKNEVPFSIMHAKRQDKDNSALRYLWARQRLSRLSDYGDAAVNKSEIVKLGLTYNLLTKYTSFIAILDKIRNLDAEAVDVKQPLPLPKGVANSAVAKRVSEPSLWMLLMIGLIGIFLFMQRNKNDKKAVVS